MAYTVTVKTPPGDIPTHRLPAESTSLSAGAKPCSDQSEQTGAYSVSQSVSQRASVYSGRKYEKYKAFSEH